MATALPLMKVVATVFLSLALYNFLELNVYILTLFKRRSGLYFWSFTVATYGVLFNSVGYMLMHLFDIETKNIYATLILIGWCCMITGQSVVLYSRLHIVMHNLRWLKYVLIMIIVNAIWLHIPVIVIVYGTNSANPEPWTPVYNVYERIQLSVFIAQELIISGLYLFETTKLLRLERTIGNVGTRRLLYHLISVNTLVILLDFSILALEFANLFEIQTSWKPLVYSVKLKLEFSILTRLVNLTRKARSGTGASSYANNVYGNNASGNNAYGNSAYGNNAYANRASEAGGVSLGTMRATSKMQRSMVGKDEADTWEVHVSSGRGNNMAMPAQVVKTTEFTVHSHSRQASTESLVESGKKTLAHMTSTESHEMERDNASSVLSDPHYKRHDEAQPW